MKLMKTSLIATLFLSVFLLNACTGPEGPMGPTGADGVDGVGTQTTYIFDISPTTESGTDAVSCPAIQSSTTSSDYSTVTCYAKFTGDTDALALPTQDSTHQYYFTVQVGQVNIGWLDLDDAVADIPDDFELIVTVVNN